MEMRRTGTIVLTALLVVAGTILVADAVRSRRETSRARGETVALRREQQALRREYEQVRVASKADSDADARLDALDKTFSEPRARLSFDHARTYDRLLLLFFADIDDALEAGAPPLSPEARDKIASSFADLEQAVAAASADAAALEAALQLIVGA
jgi:hypothetical protein